MALPFFPDPVYALWFFGLPLLAFLIIISIIAIRKIRKARINPEEEPPRKV